MVYSFIAASSMICSEKACLAETLFSHVTEGEIHLATSRYVFIHVTSDLKLYL